MKQQQNHQAADLDVVQKALYEAFNSFIPGVPDTDGTKSKDPVARARSIAKVAAVKSAALSATWPCRRDRWPS